MPSSRKSGMMRGSRLRSHREYSLCSTEMECTACARRIVFSPASDRPRKRTLPPRPSRATPPPPTATGTRPAPPHEPGHRPYRFLDGNCRAHTMLIQEVDAIGGEPPERTVDCLAHAVGPAVQAGNAFFAEPEAELRRDNDLVSPALQRASQELLVGIRSVCFGSVEQRHTKLDRTVNRRDRFELIALFRTTVGLTHAHTAKTESGHNETLCTKCAGAQHRLLRLLQIPSGAASGRAKRPTTFAPRRQDRG